MTSLQCVLERGKKYSHDIKIFQKLLDSVFYAKDLLHRYDIIYVLNFFNSIDSL